VDGGGDEARRRRPIEEGGIDGKNLRGGKEVCGRLMGGDGDRREDGGASDGSGDQI